MLHNLDFRQPEETQGRIREYMKCIFSTFYFFNMLFLGLFYLFILNSQPNVAMSHTPISYFPGGLKYVHKSPRDLVRMQVLLQVYDGA